MKFSNLSEVKHLVERLASLCTGHALWRRGVRENKDHFELGLKPRLSVGGSWLKEFLAFPGICKQLFLAPLQGLNPLERLALTSSVQRKWHFSNIIFKVALCSSNCKKKILHGRLLKILAL